MEQPLLTAASIFAWRAAETTELRVSHVRISKSDLYLTEIPADEVLDQLAGAVHKLFLLVGRESGQSVHEGPVAGTCTIVAV